jgi:hypothetical protein
MPIHEFDKMAESDQDEFVAALILGAQTVLAGEGRSDLADAVHRLFTKKKNSADQISLGMGEFEINLARAREADKKRAEKDRARPLEVEDVLAVTLKKNGIELPDSFFSVAKDFIPKRAPKGTP